MASKKILILMAFSLILSMSAFSQAKKPTLMVVPSDLYCNQHGYMQRFNNQGQIKMVPECKKALQNDPQSTDRHNSNMAR